MPLRRIMSLAGSPRRPQSAQRAWEAGPAVAPEPPTYGPVAAARALLGLPGDLLVALGYVVHELPLLVQDLRSAVNDVARIAHVGDPGALSDLLAGLSRAHLRTAP